MPPNEPSLAPPNIREFYSRLLRLLEFTRDMDRNNSDSTFVARGKRNVIHYVFDENIFEFFIGARDQYGLDERNARSIYSDKRKYSSVFHLKAWRDEPNDDSNEKRWIRVNRQTAAVTAEYLFSGRLPGQAESRIYLTEWHWTELLNRFHVLYDHFRHKAKAATDRKEPLDAVLRSIQEVRELAAADTMTAERLAESLHLTSPDRDGLLGDLKRLKENDINNSTLVTFVTARIIASKLIDDDILEPFQQIRRIFSRDLASRLRPLHLLSPTPTAADRKILSKASADWEALIRQEEAQRDATPEMRRNSRRIAADAQSLAYVQWMADRLENNDSERIIMVTGDNLLFDAYRRWWSARPHRSFALRRVTQFAPILNFKDARSGVTASDEIFEKTRRAIEPPLMYFNLAEQVDTRIPVGQLDAVLSTEEAEQSQRTTVVQRHGGREHFALLLKSRDPLGSNAFKLFAQNIGADVIAERQADYTRIRDLLQELERIAIGVNHNLIARRLDDAERVRLLSLLARAEADAGQGFEKYINERLDEVYAENAALYVPATFAALRTWLASQIKTHRFTRRAPIALRLRAPAAPEGSGVRQSLARIVDDLISLGAGGADVSEAVYELERGTWLQERPELLFAVAATTALRLALWDQAAFYAKLAVGSESAKSIFARKDASERADYFELLYLRALSTRFQIGDISSVDEDGEVRSRQLLEFALRDLSACIEYHVNGTEDEGRHILRELRARSERAAVRIFYSSWFLRARAPRRRDPEETVTQMLLAYSDLKTANEMFLVASERVAKLDVLTNSTDYSDLLRMLHQQVAIHWAAWFVFRKILELYDKRLASRLDYDPAIVSVVRDSVMRMERTNLQSERAQGVLSHIYAFSWIYDGSEFAWEKFNSLPPPLQSVSLQLDAELVDLYRSVLADKTEFSVIS